MLISKFTRIFFIWNLLLIVNIILFQCSKKQSTEVKDVFSGITQTNEQSPESTNIDPDDWKHDLNWKYNNLYLTLKDSIEIIPKSGNENSDTTGTAEGDSTIDIINQNVITEYAIHPAFPNPVSNYCNIYFSLPAYCEVVLFIIDQSHNITRELVLKTLEMGHHMVCFDCQDRNGNPLSSGIYRCIYRFEDKDKGDYGIFCGHGDIEIKR